MDPHRRHFGATAPAANSPSFLPPPRTTQTHGQLPSPQHHQQHHPAQSRSPTSHHPAAPPPPPPPPSHLAQRNPSPYQQQQQQQQQHSTPQRSPHLPQQLPPPQTSSVTTRRDSERDRPFSTTPGSAPKRLKMNGRTPSREEYFSPYGHPQQQQQHQPAPPPPPSTRSTPGPSPRTGTIPPFPRYGDGPRSPEQERSGGGPLSGYRGPDAIQQQNPMNPAANRGSPASFHPAHRASTPDNHSVHRRTPSSSSYHNSPQVARGPQHDSSSSSMSQPQHPPTPQHPQQHPNLRGMPPPSSPRHSHSNSQSGPLRPPPPPMHPNYNPGHPGPHSRELPSLASLPVTRVPSMSISSMLDSGPPVQSPKTTGASPVSAAHSLPPPNLISRPHELSPLKGPFTPDFGPERPRDIGSTSASPSSASAPLPSLSGSAKLGHGPAEPVFRAHQQLQHHSNSQPLEREPPPLGGPLYGHRGPPRPLSQPVHPSQPIGGMHDEIQNARHARSGSVSERERRYEQDQQRYMRDREMQERDFKNQQDAERQRMMQMEREQREQQDRERMEREKRDREREMDQRKRGDPYPKQEHFGPPGAGPSMFGRETMDMQNPQGQGHPGFMGGPSRFGPNGINKQPPSDSAPPNHTPGATSGPGMPSAPAPLPPASREGGFPQYGGYGVSGIPPSPFGMQQSGLPALPQIGNDARDRDGRPQRSKTREPGPPAPGREEPLRAEDALQRGINRSLSSLIEDDKRRNVGKDRDGIIKDKDGFMRLTDASVTYHSPPRRSMASGFTTGGREWGELPPMEKDKDPKPSKRDREDDESLKSEKKKRHHHHHTHVAHHHPHPHPHHHHHHHHDDSLEPPTSSTSRSRSPLHLHRHHSHHHAVPSPYRAPQPALSKLTTTLIIDSSKVLASLTTKPRHYLGSMVYLPHPVPKPGMSVKAPLLPRFEGRENSIFQIRIPKRFLTESYRAETCRDRHLWGSEVYTDDSDVLTVLMHTGRIPSAAPSELLPNSRKVVVQGSVTNTPTVPASKWGASNPPPTEPEFKENHDLLVDVIILPTLEQYRGTTRFGIRSRSWKGVHDGMSYSIWDTKWVPAGEAEARGGRGKKRRLDEREFVRRWGERLEKEAAVAGAAAEDGIAMGVVKGGWWGKVGA